MVMPNKMFNTGPILSFSNLCTGSVRANRDKEFAALYNVFAKPPQPNDRLIPALPTDLPLAGPWDDETLLPYGDCFLGAGMV
jgi:hypothetical protein